MSNLQEKKDIQPTRALGKEIKAHSYFTMGFGCIIGVGWIILLGKWLKAAGPLGAIIAFAAGAFFMMLIGLCYAELATLMPVAGGEVAYSYEIFGIKASFITGWFLSLNYITVTAFEAISAGWLVTTIFPILKGGALYVVRGEPVILGILLVALIGTAYLTYINYRGIKSAVLFQDITTYGLFVAAGFIILAGLFRGKLSNLEPLLSNSDGRSLFTGILAVFIITPFMYSGFNIIPQCMEEKSAKTSLNLAGKTILFSLGAAALFYILIILTGSMVSPWKSIVNMELPAAGAFQAAFNSSLMAKIVLVGGLLGIVTTWNTVFIGATRIIFALGRAQIIPRTFGKVHPKLNSPHVSVIFVLIIASLSIFLGRSMILPIVNVAGGCFSVGCLFTCLGVIKLRLTKPDMPRPYRAPGGIATGVLGALVSLTIIFLTLYQPYMDSGGRIPLEWIIVLTWIALGILFWVAARKIRNELSPAERRKRMLGSLVEASSECQIAGNSKTAQKV